MSYTTLPKHKWPEPEALAEMPGTPNPLTWGWMAKLIDAHGVPNSATREAWRSGWTWLLPPDHFGVDSDRRRLNVGLQINHGRAPEGHSWLPDGLWGVQVDGPHDRITWTSRHQPDGRQIERLLLITGLLP